MFKLPARLTCVHSAPTAQLWVKIWECVCVCVCVCEACVSVTK